MSTLFEDMEDLDLLMALIWGEARGELVMGQIAVGAVVRNRLRDPRWPKTWSGVILQRKQFSCFNPNDPNINKIIDGIALKRIDSMWRQCRWVAGGIMYDYLPDPTKGANHYHTKGCDPSWDDNVKPTIQIGAHVFYKL